MHLHDAQPDPLRPSDMTTQMLHSERRSVDWSRANAAHCELERRERMRHETTCALVERMVSRMASSPIDPEGRLS